MQKEHSSGSRERRNCRRVGGGWRTNKMPQASRRWVTRREIPLPSRLWFWGASSVFQRRKTILAHFNHCITLQVELKASTLCLWSPYRVSTQHIVGLNKQHRLKLTKSMKREEWSRVWTEKRHVYEVHDELHTVTKMRIRWGPRNQFSWIRHWSKFYVIKLRKFQWRF